MENKIDPLVERYQKMHETGRERLLLGDFVPWRGLSEAEGKRAIVAEILDGGSVYQDLVEKLRSHGGVDWYLSGRDYPTHLTVQQGNEVARDWAQGEVHPHEDGMSPGAPPVDYSIAFAHLVVSGGNVLLCASDIPMWLKLARAMTSAQLEQMGVEPIPIDIAHVTVGRVTSEDVPEKVLTSLFMQLEALRKEIAQEPIQMQGVGTFFGSVDGLLALPPDA